VQHVDLAASTVDVVLLDGTRELKGLPFDAVAKLDTEYYESKVSASM
jgi:hypothetical protein